MDILEKRQDEFFRLSDEIWAFAEVGFDLEQSADLLCDFFEREGFEVTRGVAGMKDAFVASYGTSGPVIGILGEYDALPNMSQVDGKAEMEPLEAGAGGHGCGHHVLGVAGVAAALFLKESGKEATIRYFGCPAEENGSGKTFMARDGIFDGVDVFLTWHPMEETVAWARSTLANIKATFHFKGKSAHAALEPHMGRSALDAAELMNVGVNYLREHIIPEARIHYAYEVAGGTASNVVHDNAKLIYNVRAPQSSQVIEIFERVVDVAKGAALMTGTTVTPHVYSGASNFLVNETLATLAHDILEQVGPVPFSKEDEQLATALRETLTEAEMEAYMSRLSTYFRHQSKAEIEGLSKLPFLNELLPLDFSRPPVSASTDVSDASWIAPTLQFTMAAFPAGTIAHTWQWVAFGRSGAIKRAMIHAAKTMGRAGLALIDDPALLERAKAEWRERVGPKGYICPIPEGVKPE